MRLEAKLHLRPTATKDAVDLYPESNRWTVSVCLAVVSSGGSSE